MKPSTTSGKTYTDKENAMANPIKIIKSISKAVTKPVVKKVQAQAVKQNKKTVEKVAKMQERTKTDAIQKSSVKVKPAAKPNTGLENRGVKLTKTEAINRARDYQWDRAEKYMDQRFDTMAGGPRAGGGNAGPGKKNANKAAALSRLTQQKIVVESPKVPVKKRGK